MHENYTLASAGEQLIELDATALAAIGGEGPLDTFIREAIGILWDCIKTGLDDVIDAAKEGYGDARG